MVINKLVQFLLLSLILSCTDDDQDACEYNGCDIRRQTIKLADNAVGRISVLSQQYPDLWVIVSEEGIIGDDNVLIDGPDIVVICDLPDSLKTNGLKVIFSGDLKNSCKDFEKGLSAIYYSTPTMITVKTN